MNNRCLRFLPAILLSLFALSTWFTLPCLAVQGNLPNELTNGDLEEYVDGRPVGWSYVDSKAIYKPDSENPFSGESCMAIDATDSKESFVTFNHPVSVANYLGKRVRFQAAIRVADGNAAKHVGLWLRADLIKENGRSKVVAFENMQRRSVTELEWQHYSIVIDIPDEADKLFLGLIVSGGAKAWIDDVTLEVVEGEVSPTGSGGGNADSSPDDFFTWWLALPAIVMALFVISFCGSNIAQRFALRFSAIYWVLYYLPEPISSLNLAGFDITKFHEYVSNIVNWFGRNLLEIDVTWAINGSGDTSYDHVRVLAVLIISIFASMIWSCLDWRKTDFTYLKDLLRSYLRYVLAFAMLGYGLAKLTTEMNQFPIPGPGRLDQAYGESSPMGLLWTFMGASRTYTNFAGLGEVVAGLLLIWRRTTILGAFVAVGVMTNVVMLNFCYDVPVKLYSTHLLVTAMFILLPDAQRILNLFLLNRASEPASFLPPYTGPRTIWVQRVLKAAVIVVGIGFPIYNLVISEMKPKAAEPTYFGVYVVDEFRIDDVVNDKLASDADEENPSWKNVTFKRYPFSREEGVDFTDVIMIRADDDSRLAGTINPGDDELSLAITKQNPAMNIPERLTISVIDEDHLEIHGGVDEGALSVKLHRDEEGTLLMTRGFHWINEAPFNR